jgi:hypothetical protein
MANLWRLHKNSLHHSQTLEVLYRSGTYKLVEKQIRQFVMLENIPFSRSHRYDDVFMSGNGRISEIVANWIVESGVEIGSSGFDSFLTDCRFYFPLSCRSEIIYAHMAWQNFQTWSKNHSELKNLELAFVSLKHLKSELDSKPFLFISVS